MVENASPTVSLDTLRWRTPTVADLGRLHAIYLAHPGDPLFVEIDGPFPGMAFEEFAAWTQEEASLRVALDDDDRFCGFLWFSAIQESIGVAFVDWGLFPLDASMDSFGAVLEAQMGRLELRRLTTLALEGSARVLQAEALGFEREGVLKNHFFHQGRTRDLVCLGKLLPS